MSVPLHCSALGKVLLAFGAAQLPGGPLERRTDKTVTSDAALRAELGTVRARGYAVTDEELEPGLIAVATPIRGYDGAVVAALSVSAPTNRLSRTACRPSPGTARRRRPGCPPSSATGSEVPSRPGRRADA